MSLRGMPMSQRTRRKGSEVSRPTGTSGAGTLKKIYKTNNNSNNEKET